MLEEYAEDKYYARLATRSYHCYRETHSYVNYEQTDEQTEILTPTPHSVRSRCDKNAAIFNCNYGNRMLNSLPTSVVF